MGANRETAAGLLKKDAQLAHIFISYEVNDISMQVYVLIIKLLANFFT